MEKVRIFGGIKKPLAAEPWVLSQSSAAGELLQLGVTEL
jgi:hypothetical protein